MRVPKVRKDWGALVVFGVWTFLVAGVGIWVILLVLKSTNQLKDAAAWVQAIGSIAAILIAVWVPYKQNEDRILAEQGRDEEQVHKILGVARYAAQVSLNADAYLNSASPKPAYVSKFVVSLDGWETLCRTVNFHEIPNVEVALGWVELTNAVRDVRGYLSSYLDKGDFDGRDFYWLQLANERARSAFDRMMRGAGVTYSDESDAGQ